MWWFKKKVPLPPIEIGSIWLLRQAEGDPWGEKYRAPITVLDTREGWVRYKMGYMTDSPSMFDDCRLQEDRFRAIYSLWEEEV